MVLTIKCVKLIPEFNFLCCKRSLKAGAMYVGRCGLILAIVNCFHAAYNLGTYLSVLDARSRQALVTSMVTGLVQFFLNALLIYGAWKEKPELILPWVMINYIGLIIASIIVIIYIIILLAMNQLGIAILVLIFGPLLIGLIGYLWTGVYCYYRQVAEANEQLDYGGEKLRPEETILYAGDTQQVHTVQPQAV